MERSVTGLHKDAVSVFLPHTIKMLTNALTNSYFPPFKSQRGSAGWNGSGHSRGRRNTGRFLSQKGKVPASAVENGKYCYCGYWLMVIVIHVGWFANGLDLQKLVFTFTLFFFFNCIWSCNFHLIAFLVCCIPFNF